MPQYIKSLELQGYKTFANRTRFEFAERVTAIVGPNGSGKSNIVDSLRWVLGEQSYGLLRGKRTDDMIFSGSEHRSRAGMASATVVLDNSKNWLPIDFNEVAVTRRAYRDAQNEYLVNGQKVRLKDVNELLSQAGLAERTYTIIGQGLVDMALSLRAEERRRLFEEAAGIGLHRGRREEALRRLETTRRNLERVLDILAELEPRLKSLENQAERAQKYEQIQTDLKVVLREWYGYYWHRTQNGFLEAQHYAQQQEDALKIMRNNQAVLAQSLGILRNEIQGMRARLNSWHRELAQLHTRREEMSRDLAVFTERRRSLQEQRQNTRDELARMEEEFGLHTERLQQAIQELEHQQAELSEANTQADSARKALQARLVERGRIEREIQTARKNLSDLHTRRDRLQARSSERQAQIERQETALFAAGDALSAAEKEFQKAQKAQKEAEQAHKQTEIARSEAESVWQGHHQKITEMEKERQQVQERVNTLRTENARLKAQLDVIMQAEQSLSGFATGTRLLVEASRKSQLAGIKGALIPNLEVPAEVETAIAAALGDYLNAVLLDSDNETSLTLDLLASNSARAALLPLKSLIPSDPPNEVNDPDCLGIAARLVHVPVDLRPAVDLLLGNVFVVRNRDAARRVLVGQPMSARAVTLQGEVFYASGPIMGGAMQSSGESGMLSRPRQRRELSEALEQAQGRLQEEMKRFEHTDKELAQMRLQGETLNRTQQESQKRAAEASSTHHRADLAVEQAQRQLQWQGEQRQRLESEIIELDKETERMSSEISQIKEQISSAQEGMRTLQNNLASLPLEELQSQVSHWEMQCAVCKRGMEDAQTRQVERQNALQRAEQTNVLLKKRVEEFQRTEQDLETQEGNRRQTEVEISLQIEAVQRQIEPAEAELDAAEKRQLQLVTEDEVARQAQSRAEQRNAQASISLARAQEALQSLRGKIEDDFGLVSFDYAAEVSGPTPLPIDGMVEALPVVNELPEDLDETLQNYRRQLRRMGAINPEARREHKEVKERYEFLKIQVADLEQAEKDIRQIVLELDSIMQTEFKKTFDAVSEEFRKVFTRLFGGGSVRLTLTDPDDLTNTGVDIEARLPGKRAQGLSLLSGGERSLTATALVFALLKTSPTPFCVLDEVDAMLDEANVGRFRDLLNEVSENTQIIIITHNRNTVQVADVIYGITMDRDTVSQIISLRLDEVDGLKGVAD